MRAGSMTRLNNSLSQISLDAANEIWDMRTTNPIKFTPADGSSLPSTGEGLLVHREAGTAVLLPALFG